MPKTTVVYIALGSNLGEPEVNLSKAAQQLGALSAAPMLASSIWESVPEGFGEHERVPGFLNAVVQISVSLGPESLLTQLQQIERRLGRSGKSGTGYESRTIDLDMIDFGGQHYQLPGLTLPHARAHQRRFVLLPLQEINPEFRFVDRLASLDELIRQSPENPMRRLSRLIPLA